MSSKNHHFVLAAILILITSFRINAQNVAINTTGAAADPSALLEVGTGSPTTGGDSKGVLVPRVALTNITVATPVTSPATSLIVFNTNASVTGGTGVGFYWWDGTKWGPIGTQDPQGLSDTCPPTEITNEINAVNGAPCAGASCTGASMNQRDCSITCDNLVYNGN